MKLVSIYKLLIIVLVFLVSGEAGNAQIWTLGQCIDAARSQNRSLEIASNHVLLSGEKEKEARANLLPRLTVNAEYKYYFNLPYQLLPLSTFNPSAPEGQFNEARFGVPHNINANLQLAVPLYNPQIYGGIEASGIGSEISSLQYRKSEEEIYFEISNLYYNAQILKAQLSFLDSNIVNTTKLLKNLALLREQSLATGTDVGKVELQIAQLSTQKAAAKNKLNQILNTLKFMIGLSADQGFDVDDDIVSSNPIIYDSTPSVEYQLLAAQGKLLQTELNTLNKVRHLPTVNFVGIYGTTGFGYDKQPGSFLKFYPLGFAGLQVTYPVFNGSITLRRMDQKRVEISTNRLKLDLIDQQNQMQVANATLDRNSALLFIEASEKQIALAQELYAKTLLQQKEGVATLADVLLADNALREAQQANLTAIITFLKADLALKKYTGNLK